MSETPSVPTPAPSQDPTVPTAAVPPAAPAAPVYAPAAPAPRGTNGFGIAALILGIIAILGAAFPFINIVSGILAVAGLIFGIIGLTRKNTGKGTSIAGTIISGIALIITIIASVIFFATISAVVDDIEDEPIVIEETEAAPEPDPIPVDPDAELGSFDNPAPLGARVTFSINDVDEWAVVAEATELNANELVAERDPSNPAPDPGFQYALVRLAFERVGTGDASPIEDLAIYFATSPDDFYAESDVTAVAPDLDWRNIAPFGGGTATANALVQIPVDSTGRWAINVVSSDFVVFFETE